MLDKINAYGFQALALALESDDARLQQGVTTTPLAATADWPCAGACVLGYAGWQGDGLETVGQVETFFAQLCYEADVRLKEASGVRWFLNWFDETPREEMRAALLAEVRLSQGRV